MRTRFAPAPTGWLHLGHVLNAEYVWDFITPASPEPCQRREVLLRIEDHDRERCRPEYESGILDDLDWLGYRPDIFHTNAFRAGVCDGRQSDRETVYREAVDILSARGLVFACDCSRRTIEDRCPRSDVRTSAEAPELYYDGYCRDRGLLLVDGYGWRVRIDSGVERFVDGRLGPQEQDPSRQCGDILIRDRLGNWTYQFAVSVDDFRQGIDLVIRGEDLLESTGRQIRLARLLGRLTPATFVHHPLLMKSPGQKLSKSDADTGIGDLRRRGWTPDQVKAAALTAHGLRPTDQRPRPADV
jgi:glutamyl-tRNA synthetase/glutamyl-Q tRNA(Asp) synthetase